MQYLFGLYQYSEISPAFRQGVIEGDLEEIVENISSASGPHVLPQLQGKPDHVEIVREKHFQLLLSAFGINRLKRMLQQELTVLRKQLEGNDV